MSESMPLEMGPPRYVGPGDRDDKQALERMRAAFKTLGKGWRLEVQCYNKGEADWLRSQLSPEEQEKVARFTWLDFSHLDSAPKERNP